MAKVSKKKREAAINSAFGKYCSGIQVPILKIPAIWKAGEQAYDESGGSIEAVGAALREAALQVAAS